ncbi:hypothetical protein ACQ4LE_003939 [Meloidogyne hapla]
MANSSTSNNSYSYQFNQNNCGKRRRTLASEMDQTSREMDLIRDKFNLQNSLMEQFNENKRIVDANNKLNELLEKTKIEKEIYKNENEKNLKEMSKLQKEYLNQFNGQSELINKNTVISIKLDFMRTKMLKREKEKELNLIEMCKLKKENEKFKEENEYLENEKTKVAEELKDLKNNFTKLKEENEVNKKEMIKLKEENELNIKEKNKIQKEMFNLNKEKKVFIDANNQRLIEIKFLNSDMEKLKKESDEKMKKMSEESLKLNKENEKILKEKIQLIKERENFRIEIFKIKGEMNLNIKNLAEYKKGLKENYNKLSKELEKSIADIANCKNEVLDLKLVRFVSIKNRINEINNQFTCCPKKCINSNISAGTCKSERGFIRVHEEGLVKYYLKGEKADNIICFYAQHSFTKAWGFCCTHSLFYYEITMIEERKEQTSYVGIGFYNITTRLSINNSSNTLWNVGEDELTCYESSWKDKDVFGCGVVFPSWKDNKVLPYMFFTKNGEIIGKKFPLSEEDDNLRPFFELLSCSIEINFGNDLVNKPFRYNIYNHI